MSYDCVDICDIVIDRMCVPCPHFNKCQMDDANHEQMVICLQNMYMKDYPIVVFLPEGSE